MPPRGSARIRPEAPRPRDASPDERDARYRDAARGIHATFRAEPRREHAARVLAQRLVPLA